MPIWHKLLQTDPEKKDEMQPKEVISYSIAGLGQNLICQLVTSFFLFFLTDAVGLDPMWLAIMFLCARLFDAFNDPIMGSIVDYTRSKYGKMRPYLLYMPIPICILTVLLFVSAVPGSNPQGQMAYATVIYILWGICYTTVDVPYWGLASSMTSDTEKRNTMLTIARLFCTIGGGIVTVFIPIFQDIVRKNVVNDFLGASAGEDLAENLKMLAGNSEAQTALAHGYKVLFLIVAIIVAVVAIPTFFLGFKNTKERFYEDSSKRASLAHNVKLLFKNKPILLLVATGVLGCLRLIYMTSALYYAKYNLGNEAIFSVLTILVVPGGLIATVTTPWLSKKLGKRNLFIISHLVGGIAMTLLYFVGLGNAGTSVASKVLFYIVLVIMGLPSGYSNILQYSMIADTIDYLEWKTGERAEGICFAMQTLISKIGMAFVAFVVLLVLGKEGYADADKLTGANAPIDGIWMMTTLLSGVSTIACTIPLFFYTFTEKKQAECVAEIAARKAALAAETAGADGETAVAEEVVPATENNAFDVVETTPDVVEETPVIVEETPEIEEETSVVVEEETPTEVEEPAEAVEDAPEAVEEEVTVTVEEPQGEDEE